MSQSRSHPDEPAQVLRLIFSYSGPDIRLVSRQLLDMIIPRSDSIHGHEGHAGTWCTVEDKGGRPVFRRILHDAIRWDVEAPADTAGQKMTRRPVAHPKGTFTVLVPAYDEGHSVAVWSSHGRHLGVRGRADEVARFPLRDPGYEAGESR